MSDQMNVNDRGALAQLLEGRSDDEINEFVNAAGVDAVLGQVFDGMRQAFVPERAAGQSAVVQWDVNTSDGTKSWTVRIADGQCSVTQGTAESPRLTLTWFTIGDFLRFVAGQLDGMQAFMSGKLRLAGDMLFAQTMQNWFAV